MMFSWTELVKKAFRIPAPEWNSLQTELKRDNIRPLDSLNLWWVHVVCVQMFYVIILVFSVCVPL